MNWTHLPEPTAGFCWIRTDDAGDGLVKVSLYTSPTFHPFLPTFQKAWHTDRRGADNYHGAVALESGLDPKYGKLDPKQVAEWKRTHEPREYFDPKYKLPDGVLIGPYVVTDAVV